MPGVRPAKRVASNYPASDQSCMESIKSLHMIFILSQRQNNGNRSTGQNAEESVNSLRLQVHCDLDSFLLTIKVMDRIVHFRYVEAAAIPKKVKTMTLIRSMHVDPELIKNTRCDMHHACLSGKSVCHVEHYLDRDVQLLRCMEDRACAFKRNYQGWPICTCPVNRASFGLN